MVRSMKILLLNTTPDLHIITGFVRTGSDVPSLPVMSLKMKKWLGLGLNRQWRYVTTGSHKSGSDDEDSDVQIWRSEIQFTRACDWIGQYWNRILTLSK